MRRVCLRFSLLAGALGDVVSSQSQMLILTWFCISKYPYMMLRRKTGLSGRHPLNQWVYDLFLKTTNSTIFWKYCLSISLVSYNKYISPNQNIYIQFCSFALSRVAGLVFGGTSDKRPRACADFLHLLLLDVTCNGWWICLEAGVGWLRWLHPP